MSNRRNHPLVKVNCAAIPSQLLESELFGYQRGAFTGADKMKIGKFEAAHRGTMFLDEIGDMPLSLQAKMLQVLQDSSFSRLGGRRDIQVDCWVLAATNQDLEQQVVEGSFREDLYYRLNIIRIYIPPLREKPEDIEPLVYHFASQFLEKQGKSRFSFNDYNVMKFFRSYSWPGNVRELRHTVERLLILGDWKSVTRELLARESGKDESGTPAPDSLAHSTVETESSQSTFFPPLKEVKRQAIQEAESKVIVDVLRATKWNRMKAAKILEVSYKALLNKIKEYDLYQGN
jgi:two-component system response regulator AtoC